MTVAHKNKTLATLLAAVLGSVGAHRFYLFGMKDRGAWLYALFSPLLLTITAGFVTAMRINLTDAWLYVLLSPLMLAVFSGFIAALRIGLTLDERWDMQHNANSGRQSGSGWAVILIIIPTFAIGTTMLIAAIARGFDLLYTGGAYG